MPVTINQIELFKHFKGKTEKVKVEGIFNFSENGFNIEINTTTYWVFPKRVIYRQKKDQDYANQFPCYFLNE